METRQNKEAEKARKARKESMEKWKAEEENIHANVQTAHAPRNGSMHPLQEILDLPLTMIVTFLCFG